MFYADDFCGKILADCKQDGCGSPSPLVVLVAKVLSETYIPFLSAKKTGNPEMVALLHPPQLFQILVEGVWLEYVLSK
jgi:hypothetical protein